MSPPDAAPLSTSALARGLAQARTLQRRFDQRSERERWLMIAAGTALAWLLAEALWLGPALASFQAARQREAGAVQALAQLQADARQLQQQGSSQARAQQSELASWRQRVREGDEVLRAQQELLVGPDRMLELLEHLLARQGELRVRALRSLGRSDVLASTGSAGSPAASAGAATATATADPGASPTLYRHGVELVVEGSYADLLAYLRALEALPQRVLFGGIGLKVEQHPRTVLTLRVYTLSRDRHWLEI